MIDSKYNIYIVNISTGKAETQIGRDLPQKKVEGRLLLGIGRINNDYFVDDVVVGSEQDLKYKEDLIIT